MALLPIELVFWTGFALPFGFGLGSDGWRSACRARPANERKTRGHEQAFMRRR